MRRLKLQRRHERATSPKGRQRVTEILHAARDIFIEEGYHSLTMRKIAARCGMTVGNLSYYYSNKQALLHDLMDAVIQGYIEDFDAIMADPSLSPEEQFEAIVRFIMEDLTTKETTYFFPELWVLANHDPVAAEGMEYVYAKERAVFVDLIGRINPALSSEACEVIALFVSASIEGMTVFVGYERVWRNRAAATFNIAAKAFLDLVKTARTEDLNALPAPDPFRPRH